MPTKDMRKSSLIDWSCTAQRDPALQLLSADHLVSLLWLAKQGLLQVPGKSVEELGEEQKENALVLLRNMADEFQRRRTGQIKLASMSRGQLTSIALLKSESISSCPLSVSLAR